jgi:hypothetical protein
MSAAPDLGDDPRQADYAEGRRAWRAALERWMAGGRLKFLRLKAADAVPPRVGGQRDGCREPGACQSVTPDLCHACPAIVSAARQAA